MSSDINAMVSACEKYYAQVHNFIIGQPRGVSVIMQDPNTMYVTGVTPVLSFKLADIAYSETIPLAKPMSIDRLVYNNNTSLPAEAEFPTMSTTTISTYTYSVTSGVQFSAGITLQVGVPEFAEESISLNFELDFSQTTEQTKTTEQTWTYSEKVPVPANSKIYADLIIDEGKYDTQYVAQLGVTGSLAFSRINGHGTTSGSDIVDFPQYFHDNIWLNNQAAYPTVSFQGNSMLIQTTGVFSGVNGKNLRIDARQIAVDTNYVSPYPTANNIANAK